ncbi:MAG: metallophosphoesterase [Nitrososphaerota archaeon]
MALLGVSAAATASTVATLDNRVEITRIDAGLGARLAFLPDIHYHDLGERHVEMALDAVAEADPDIVVLGGDLVDEETRDFDGLERLLKEVSRGENIAVLGNHEWWSGYSGRAATLLRRNGFKLLSNEYGETSIGGIYGYDWGENRAYHAIKFNGLVISHDPNAADSVSGGALVLAGHTHGGFNLLGLTIYSNSRYTRGLYSLRGGVRLYVSRGLGQMFLQPRIHSKPELLVID